MGNECSSRMSVDVKANNNQMFTTQEIDLLRETFDQIKYGGQKRQLAQKSIDCVFKLIPEAREKISFDARRRGDDSNLMRRGMVFLDGIEQALKVANQPILLQGFITNLTAGHRQRHNVDVYMMAEALDALKSVVVPYLQVKHGHRSTLLTGQNNSNNNNNNTNQSTNASLARFFADEQANNKNSNSQLREDNCKICQTWERFFRHLRALIIASDPEK